MQQRLQLYQKQKLSVSLQQSLKILQLPGYDLIQFLDTFSYENPLIELDHNPSIYENDDSWDTSLYGGNRGLRDFCDPADFATAPFSRDSLSEYLKSQIPYHILTKNQVNTVYILISCLNSKGFFDEDCADIATRLHIPAEQVLFGIEQIKKMEPAGVGAHDLRECLLIQLERMSCPNQIAIAALRDGHDLLAAGKVSQLAKKIGVDREQLLAALCVLKSLNPYPSNGFADSPISNYIVPDIFVYEKVSLNPSVNPRLSYSQNIDKYYQSELGTDTKKYINDKKREARLMIEAVNLRSNTLHSVAAAIVEIQHTFFETGRTVFVPMTLEDVSHTINMHVSTISRAISGKYLKCQWGIFPLKIFFSREFDSEAHFKKRISSSFVKQKIEELIASENKHRPYSDLQICRQLNDLGINISRRCITKYREQLNIPTSYLRAE